jgi:hypothetical protein
VRLEGLSGRAGAEVVEEDERDEDCGFDAEKPVEDPIEDDRAGELAETSAFVNRW